MQTSTEQSIQSSNSVRNEPKTIVVKNIKNNQDELE